MRPLAEEQGMPAILECAIGGSLCTESPFLLTHVHHVGLEAPFRNQPTGTASLLGGGGGREPSILNLWCGYLLSFITAFWKWKPSWWCKRFLLKACPWVVWKLGSCANNRATLNLSKAEECEPSVGVWSRFLFPFLQKQMGKKCECTLAHNLFGYLRAWNQAYFLQVKSR